MPIEYTPIVVPMRVTSTEETVPMGITSTQESVHMTPTTTIEAIRNYQKLTNKPSINGVELFGNKSAYELGLAYKIKYDSVEGWAANIDYIPLEGEVIIYTDYDVVDGVKIPAFKVGDGMAYAADLPFVNDIQREEFINHINDTVIHITEDERAFWNNKVRCYLDDDTIVFTVH